VKRLLLLVLILTAGCSFDAASLTPGDGGSSGADRPVATDSGVVSVDARPADATVDAPIPQPDAPIPQPDAPLPPDAPPSPPDAPPDASIDEPDAEPEPPDAAPPPDAPPPPPDARRPDARPPDAPPPPDAPLPPDAAPDAPPPPPDAAPDAAPLGVQCGATLCDPGDYCCIRTTGSGQTRACNPTFDCPANGTPYECDGPEDCGENQECCDLGIGSFCTAEGMTCFGSLLCHTDDDCPPEEQCTNDQPYDSCN